MRRWRMAGLALAACLGLAARADGPHAHGVAALDVALDGRTLTLEFRAPLEDVLGFERRPANDKDRAAFEAAANWLKGGQAFVPAAAANCRPADNTVAVEERGKGHFELVARLAYDCKEPQSLGEIDVAVFGKYRKLKRIDARTVTARGQAAARLTAAKPKLTL